MTEIRHRAIQRKCFAFFSLVIWRAPGAGSGELTCVTRSNVTREVPLSISPDTGAASTSSTACFSLLSGLLKGETREVHVAWNSRAQLIRTVQMR